MKFPYSPSVMDRFWSYVKPAGPLTYLGGDEARDEAACWEWIGHTAGGNNEGGDNETKGYGTLRVGRGAVYAHRLSYETFIGPIPAGLHIDHLCRNRLCVNPRHLEPVTQQVNVLRGVGPAALNAKKTVCKRGHPLEVIGPRRRMCPTCRKASRLEASARRSARRKAIKALIEESKAVLA